MTRLVLVIIIVGLFESCGGGIKYEVNPPVDYRLTKLDTTTTKLTRNSDTLVILFENVLKKDSSWRIPKGFEFQIAQQQNDYFKSQFIYFVNEPKEIYRIDLANNIQIAKQLNATNNKNHFLIKQDLTNEEIVRIKKRFLSEFLPLLQREYVALKSGKGR